MGWTDPARVARYLGPPVTDADPFLADCVNAANDWAPRKRRQAGYDDDPLIAPTEDVAHGTTIYAGVLYRERGSADSFASFEETAGFNAVGTMGQVKRLLGIGRGRVDIPLDQLPVVNPLVRRRLGLR
jgi:hypothetical protein